MKKLLACLSILSLSILFSGCAGTLHMAAGKGDIQTVKKLLDDGADINEDAKFGGPPLQQASYFCHVETVKFLLERGANVNAVRSSSPGKGMSALHTAAMTGCTDVLRLLIDKGASIDPLDDETRSTPLAWAASSNKVAAVKLLLEKGADPDMAVSGLDRQNNASAVQIVERVATGLQKGQRQIAAKKETGSAAIKSDIDELPLAKAKPSKNSYAIVIGIEQYRQKLPSADFAFQDAKLVTEYLTKVLGYPGENVITLTNDRAAKSDFEKYFEKWLPNNVESDSALFVYYSGHGAPNPQTGDAYLVPYDGDPAFIDETGYSLKRLYAALGKLPAKEVIVALDSCFSGAGGRSVIAKGLRPLVMNLQTSVVPANVTVLAASSGEQTSATYDEKGHGLFTYYLLKGIKEGGVVRQDGSLSLAELHAYLKPQVASIARKKYNNEQTPQLLGGQH